MNDNRYNFHDDEVGIDFINLIFYLVKQWRVLLVVIVLGAILGGGLYELKKPINTENLDNVSTREYEVAPDVKVNMDLAFRYHELYDSQIVYSKNSLIMQMDSNAVYTGKLKYYLSADNNTLTLSEKYMNIINDDEVLKDIIDITKMECDSQYLREILSVSASNYNEMWKLEENEGGTFPKALIVYTVCLPEKDLCEKTMEILQDKIENMDSEYQEEFDYYFFENVGNSIQIMVNSDYAGKKKNNVDLISNYLSNISRLESSFDEDDLNYYNAVYFDKNVEENTDGIHVEQVSSSVEEMLLWILGGIALACGCWGIYCFIKYLFDKHIKTTEEIRRVYGAYVLGCVKTQNMYKNIIDGGIDTLMRKISPSLDSISYVKSAVIALKEKNILLCGDLKDISVSQLFTEFESDCPDFNMTDYVHQNKDLLKKISDFDGEIIVVHLGKTSHAEFRRELEVCNMQGFPVLGVIAIM